MPTFSVQVEVNVPGLGLRTFTTAGIVAPDIDTALASAKNVVIIKVTAIQQTAPTP